MKRRKGDLRAIIGLLALGSALALTGAACVLPWPKPEKPEVSSPAAVDPVKPAVQEPSPPEPPPSPKLPEPAPPPPPTPPPSRQETKPAVVYHAHTVRWSGETLSLIALWYTGEGGNWKPIAQANPEINPNRIFEGDEILIPEILLKTRDPLPKDFVDRFYARGKKEKTKPPPAPSPNEELKLFEPKKSPNKPGNR